MFIWAAKMDGVGALLKPGDYEIEAGASIASVLSQMTDGAAGRLSVTVVEGRTTHEVVEMLRADTRLTGEIERVPAEGAVAPNTYAIHRGDDRQSVLDRMTAAQSRLLAELWENRAPDLPLSTPQEALILASIIEKETGVDGERGLVASVFINRLRDGWKLQSDPTVIYGITLGRERLGRFLSRTDLRTPTPYNTYTIPALPPGPIANPGRDAIAAALNPAESDYYFFVADGTGGHVFNQTLDAHNAAADEWRALRDARSAEQE